MQRVRRGSVAGNDQPCAIADPLAGRSETAHEQVHVLFGGETADVQEDHGIPQLQALAPCGCAARGVEDVHVHGAPPDLDLRQRMGVQPAGGDGGGRENARRLLVEPLQGARDGAAQPGQTVGLGVLREIGVE